MTAQDWIEVLGWGTPIGLGIFFFGFGVFFVAGSGALYLLAKAGQVGAQKQK